MIDNHIIGINKKSNKIEIYDFENDNDKLDIKSCSNKKLEDKIYEYNEYRKVKLLEQLCSAYTQYSYILIDICIDGNNLHFLELEEDKRNLCISFYYEGVQITNYISLISEFDITYDKNRISNIKEKSKILSSSTNNGTLNKQHNHFLENNYIFLKNYNNEKIKYEYEIREAKNGLIIDTEIDFYFDDEIHNFLNINENEYYVICTKTIGNDDMIVIEKYNMKNKSVIRGSKIEILIQHYQKYKQNLYRIAYIDSLYSKKNNVISVFYKLSENTYFYILCDLNSRKNVKYEFKYGEILTIHKLNEDKILIQYEKESNNYIKIIDFRIIYHPVKDYDIFFICC